jgi:hypothetical protein
MVQTTRLVLTLDLAKKVSALLLPLHSETIIIDVED